MVRPDNQEAIDAGRLKSSGLISESIMRWWIYEFMEPLESYFVKNKVSPNTLTAIGFFLTCLGGLLLGTGHLIWGGWVVIFAGCFDFFDGRVARRTGRVTQAGAFFDSVLDRYMDSAVFVGLIFYFKDSWFFSVVLAAFIGSMLTPYIRAKVESLGMQSKEGAMQRPERVLYVGLGAAFSGYVMILMYPFYEPGQEVPPFLLMIALTFVAVMSNRASYQRFSQAFNQLKQRS